MPVTYKGHYKVTDGNGGKRGNFGDIATAMTCVSEFAPNAAIKETVFEIKFTVKGHDTYCDVPQTKIYRVKAVA